MVMRTKPFLFLSILAVFVLARANNPFDKDSQLTCSSYQSKSAQGSPQNNGNFRYGYSGNRCSDRDHKVFAEGVRVSNSCNPIRFSQLSGANVFASRPLFLSIAICNEYDVLFYNNQTVMQNFAQLTVAQQESVLKHHGWYESDNFLNTIKHFPCYSDYIKGIYKEYNKLGWWKSKRRGLPSNIKKLHRQVTHQEVQDKKSQKQHPQAQDTGQKVDQGRKERFDYLHTMHVEQKDMLVDLMDEHYEQLREFDDDDQGDPLKDRIEKRYQALQKSFDSNFVISEKKFALSQDATTIIDDYSLDRQSFVVSQGSEYQHALHAEHVDLLDRLGSKHVFIKAHSRLRVVMTTLIEALEFAREANSSANIDYAIAGANFYWALYDCVLSFIEGGVDGVIGLAHMATHPV